MAVTDALRVRDDWSEIQMRHANGESLNSLARYCKVFPTQLQRALCGASPRRLAEAKEKITRQRKHKIEPVEKPGKVTEDLPVTRTTREPQEFSVENSLNTMQEIQAALQGMAETYETSMPSVAVSAYTAALNAGAKVLQAAVDYQVHTEKDIHNHPGFNRMLSSIMIALEPFPEAMEAVKQTVEATA